MERLRLLVSLGVVLCVCKVPAQSTSVLTIGTTTASKVTNGLGVNISNPEQEWQWSAAKAMGAKHARFQCAWSAVEQQTPVPNNQAASPQFVQTANCETGLTYAREYGLIPTIVAAYGPPAHQILTLTLAQAAAVGDTSLLVEFASGVAGSELSRLYPPYDYVAQTSGAGISAKGSYTGSLISEVSLTSSTTATLGLASAVATALPAGSALYVNEILYPSTTTNSGTETSVIHYGDYVSFLAQSIASYGLEGDVEIWNEPPWTADPWDQRSSLYDYPNTGPYSASMTYAQNAVVTESGTPYISLIANNLGNDPAHSSSAWSKTIPPNAYTGIPTYGANFGFAENIATRSFPTGVTATWAGTNKTSTASLLSSTYTTYTGKTWAEPSLTITKQSDHPYGGGSWGNPEEHMWQNPCILAAVAAGQTPRECGLIPDGNTNDIEDEIENYQEQAIDTSYGLGMEITETNDIAPGSGYFVNQARANVRQFIGFEGDQIDPVEFFSMCWQPGDPTYSLVLPSSGTSCTATSTYDPTPAYIALAGFASDVSAIDNTPVTSYSAADLPSVTSYSGTYPLAVTNIVGARSDASANSYMLAIWQLSECHTTTDCWWTLASPAAGTAIVDIPSGMDVVSVRDELTQSTAAYSITGKTLTVSVADDPIEIIFDPSALDDETTGRSSGVAKTTMSLTSVTATPVFGSSAVLKATLSPFTSSGHSTNGETVSFYNGSSLLGTGTLSSGVATTTTASLPAGSDNVYAVYAGDKYLASTEGYAVVTVATAAPTLKLPAVPTQTVGEGMFTVLATSNSSANISYSIVTGGAWIGSQSSSGGASIKPLSPGTVVLKASQGATGNHAAATAEVTFTIDGQNPELSFTTIGTKLYPVTTSVTLKASSSSSGAVTYSVVSGPATVSGNTVTLTGAGTVVLSASQAASGAYAAATAQTSFTVNQQTTPTLKLPAVATQTVGEGMFTVLATSNSSANISYSIVTGGAWIGSQSSSGGASIKPLSPGTVVLKASQGATGNHAAATAEVTFTIDGQNPELSFTTIGTKLYPVTTSVTLKASSSSSGAVTYSVVSGPATVSGNTVTLTGAGTVVLSASQAASGAYAAATAQTSFTVNQQTTPTLKLPAVATQTVGEGMFTVLATSNSPANISYSIVTGPAWIGSQSSSGGASIKPLNPGTVVLSASQGATGNYAAATNEVTFTVVQ